MKTTSKTRPSKVLLFVGILLVTLTTTIVGLYPTGIIVTNLKEAIHVYDKLYTNDFDVQYTNRFKINIPISERKKNEIVVEPSEINADTKEINISLGEYTKKLLTSPIQVKYIKTNIDNKEVYEGDKLNKDDVTAKLIYNDNTELDITNDIQKELKEEYTYLENNDINVESKYGTIELKPIIHNVSSITGNIKGIGTETGVWYSGETPIIDSINVNYSNGEIRTVELSNINSDFEVSDSLINIVNLQPGINEYSVNFADKEFKFDIVATPFIKNINIADKTVFLDGETLETAVNKITKYVITYEDDTTETVSLNDIHIINSLDTVIKQGENKIDVEYLGRIFNLNITGRIKTKANIAASNSLKELADSNYSHISDSIFTTITKKSKGSGEYWLTHVVVNDVNQLKAGLSYDDFGGTREKPTDASKRLNWVVGGNASYFSYNTGEPACASVFIRDGQIIKGSKTNGNEVCILSDGRLYTPPKGIDAQELINMDVRDIWGTCDPLLIQDGQLKDLSNVKKNSYPRCAIGMVSPGEYYMITAGKNGYKAGLTFKQMQDIFNSLGCAYARSLDGGGSATLVFNNKLINSPAAKTERPVVDFIYFTK